MYWISLFAFICVFSSFSPFIHSTDPETGTLIVSYQTGPRGERLDRVRFLLSSNLHPEQMYPRGQTYVEDATCPSRMVAIENLPAGNYSIKFIIPNADGLFEE